MKRTSYFITVRENGKTQAKRVDGYFEYIDGLPLGVHKAASKFWTVTELSTGLAIVSGDTRAGALAKAVSMADTVKHVLADTDTSKAKTMISKAYAAV